MKTMSPPKRKRFREIVRSLDYAAVANMLRECIETGHPDTAAMQILAERAWAIAPTEDLAEIMLKFHTAFSHGRRIRFSTGKITSVDGMDVDTLVDRATIEEIDSIEVEDEE